MKKTTIYIRSKNICPAGYYRVLQYTYKISKNITYHSVTPPIIYKWYHRLNKKNLLWNFLVKSFTYSIMALRTTYNLFLDAYIRKPEQIVIQRTILPRYMPIFIAYLLKKATKKTKLIWDFDDDLFETHEISKREKNILIECSWKIIVINTRLKLLLPKEVHKKVIMLPTTDGDMQYENRKKIEKNRKKTFKKEVKLIWVATPSNIRNLYYILPELDKTSKELEDIHKQLKLIIVCSIPVKYKTESLQIENRKWSHQVAINAMKEAHIGIMPLIYGKHALGKGGFKIIQSLSIGLPVIASNVGFNKEIITPDCGVLVDDIQTPYKWSSNLLHLIQNNKLEKMSESAYQRWKEEFSYQKNFEHWVSFLE